MTQADPTADTGAAAQTLGALLSGTEARQMAERLADDQTLTAAVRVVEVDRRAEVRELLDRGVRTSLDREATIAVLRGIAGARSTVTALDSLWTMPGHLAQSGPLTSSVSGLVDRARVSVTCSTFNFQRSSGLWHALRRAAHRPEMLVRVYVDTAVADEHTKPWSPTTAEIAAHLAPAHVLRTKDFDGGLVRNHAKFLAIDHRFLLVTSANFSWSAEQGNVEFGVFIDNPDLVDSVEQEMRQAEPALYERVMSGPRWA